MYDNYDSVLNSMKDVLDSFKSISLRKEDSTRSNSQEEINIQLSGLVKTFEQLFSTRVGSDKLFDVETHAGIGENLVVPRTFSDTHLDYNNQKISEVLQNQIDTDTVNLEELDEVFDLLNLKQMEIGARQSSMNVMKDIYTKEKLTSNEFLEKRKDLIGSIQNLNRLQISYEALSKIISGFQEMSLVKYI